MNKHWIVAIAVMTVAYVGISWAKDEEKPKSPPAAPANEPSEADDLKAIRATESSFKTAFDAGKAEEVAAHWTTDGEYVDEDGRRVQGRDEIAKEYAAFFAANPGVHITSHIDRVRLVNAGTAIEDGTALLDPAPAGAPGKSRYTVVHVKQDGKWLMCSVRETRVATPSNYPHLEDLDAMIGTWVAENQGVEFQVTCRWIANKNFLEQSFESRRGEDVISSGTQIIGWDPGTAKIASWTFTSDGGHAVGSWTPHESGWIIEATGVMPDGTPTTAVNIVTGLDANGIAWRSVNRTAGAFRVLDTEEVILRRKPAAQN